MNFFLHMKKTYAPYMAPDKFCDVINEVETELFEAHPEYLELPVAEQNKYVEEAYRAKYVNNN